MTLLDRLQKSLFFFQFDDPLVEDSLNIENTLWANTVHIPPFKCHLHIIVYNTLNIGCVGSSFRDGFRLGCVHR